MGKFATIITTNLSMWEGKEKELAELNKARMELAGFTSDWAKVVVCPHCGKESLAGPKLTNAGEIINKLPPGWKKKAPPIDPLLHLSEKFPPDEKEKQAKLEMEKAKEIENEAIRERNILHEKIAKLNKSRKGFINSMGDYVEEKPKVEPREAMALAAAATKLIDEKHDIWIKAQGKYNRLYQNRMFRINQYRMEEDKKLNEKLEKERKAKQKKSWRKRINEIVDI